MIQLILVPITPIPIITAIQLQYSDFLSLFTQLHSILDNTSNDISDSNLLASTNLHSLLNCGVQLLSSTTNTETSIGINNDSSNSSTSNIVPLLGSLQMYSMLYAQQNTILAQIQHTSQNDNTSSNITLYDESEWKTNDYQLNDHSASKDSNSQNFLEKAYERAYFAKFLVYGLYLNGTNNTTIPTNNSSTSPLTFHYDSARNFSSFPPKKKKFDNFDKLAKLIEIGTIANNTSNNPVEYYNAREYDKDQLHRIQLLLRERITANSSTDNNEEKTSIAPNRPSNHTSRLPSTNSSIRTPLTSSGISTRIPSPFHTNLSTIQQNKQKKASTTPLSLPLSTTVPVSPTSNTQINVRTKKKLAF